MYKIEKKIPCKILANFEWMQIYLNNQDTFLVNVQSTCQIEFPNLQHDLIAKHHSQKTREVCLCFLQ